MKKENIKILLCNFVSVGGEENWLEFSSIASLAGYFTSGNYYKKLRKVVKNRELTFRGYKLKYVVENPNFKTCSMCLKEKSIDEFGPHKHGKFGKHSRCKFCQRSLQRSLRLKNPELQKAKHREYVKDFNKRNPDSIKNSKLKTYYDISLETFEQMKLEQNNLCSICKKPEVHMRKGVLRELNVDHCHETGKVRGLLCNGCNTGLGQFKDNIESLLSAVEYLKKHGK